MTYPSKNKQWQKSTIMAQRPHLTASVWQDKVHFLFSLFAFQNDSLQRPHLLKCLISHAAMMMNELIALFRHPAISFLSVPKDVLDVGVKDDQYSCKGCSKIFNDGWAWWKQSM